MVIKMGLTVVPIKFDIDDMLLITTWLINNIGSNSDEIVWDYGENYEHVRFKYEKDAILFSLKWS